MLPMLCCSCKGCMIFLYLYVNTDLVNMMYILIWSILLYCSLFQSVAILNDFLFISIHSSQLELQQDWIVIKVHLWNKCSLCVYVRVYVCVCVCVPSAEGCLRPK